MRILLSITISLFLFACAGQKKYSKSNPVYQGQNLLGSETVALLLNEEALFFNEPERLSQWMGVSERNFAKDFRPWFSQEIVATMQKDWRAPLPRLAPPLPLQKEKVALDANLYLTASLPAQGEEISQPEGKAPRYLWILHEVVLGPYLNREKLFDLTLSQKESKTEISQNPEIGLIISFSLWDNQKQNYLHHGITEQRTTFSGNLSVEIIQDLLQKSTQDLFANAPWRKQ